MTEREFLLMLEQQIKYLALLDARTMRIKLVNDFLPILRARIQDVEMKEREAKQ